MKRLLHGDVPGWLDNWNSLDLVSKHHLILSLKSTDSDIEGRVFDTWEALGPLLTEVMTLRTPKE